MRVCFRSRHGLFALLTGLLVWASAVDRAQAYSGRGCVTTECHSKLATGRSIHKPIKSGQCQRCHLPATKGFVGPAHDKGTFVSPDASARLCLKCHPKTKRSLAQKHRHKPATKLPCGFCHSPHSSTRRSLLKASPRAPAGQVFCFMCHQKQRFWGPNAHRPVAQGKCQQCHDSHGSAHPRLLVMAQKKLCLKCHKLKWNQRKFVHGPVAAGTCSACHSPHIAAETKLLKYPRHRLCFACHKKDGTDRRHAGIGGYSKGCLHCHDAHATNKRHMLKGP